MSRALAEAFERKIQRFLESHPEVRHEWRGGPGERTLVFPPADATGFEVWALVSDGNLVVGAGGVHDHFEFEPGDTASVADKAVTFIRDLLSPRMRLRERSAGGRVYRWDLQRLERGEWKRHSFGATFFLNWFAPRSERIKQNHALPSETERN